VSLCLNKHHAIKTYWGSGGVVPCILDLGSRWPLYAQRKSPWYPLGRRLAGPQSRSGRGGEEKNSQPQPGIELQNPDRPARSMEDSIRGTDYKYGGEVSKCKVVPVLQLNTTP
jgi:hypothetical protein